MKKEKVCWICRRTVKEIIEYIEEDCFDEEEPDTVFLKIQPYNPKKEQKLHFSLIKKPIYICHLCWGLLQISFHHEFKMVKEALEAALPKGFADELIESFEYQGL